MSLSVGDIFEEYIESLTNLPSEIDQNMHELRSMDEDFQRHRDAYSKHKRSYLKLIRTNNSTSTSSSPSTPSPGSTVHMTTSRSVLEKDYKLAIQKQDQKIELAMRMYDLVSRHIERIDSQMAQNNISITMPNEWIQQRQQHHRSTLHTNGSSTTHLASSSALENVSVYQSRKGPHWDDWRGDGNRKRSLLHGTTGPRKRTHHSTRPNPAMNSGALVEHDIDPNEPRYCYCNQVSFGDMVACDGDNCDKEWFHYACVGLAEPPAGKWFCDDCSVDENNQRKLKRYG
ncbi:uncharacterized protein BX664DRAFT_331465 [Halteromyces radiatus]|uniref:uncharacterized protein n=1 Tax=Halteromyces radiatus TaxID=101107 RepID=UPI00221E833F|nr:uncharacterized protein BX664DRAFT_331465 [Halteromyces radiatus]KAI8088819.1 hypothetical protein BX664DRAFT_331465 [Halteromyces radiatus]